MKSSVSRIHAVGELIFNAMVYVTVYDDHRRRRTRDESPLRTVAVAIGLSIFGILAPLVILFIAAIALVSTGVELDTTLFGGLVVAQFLLFGVVALGYLRWRGFTTNEIRGYLGVRLPSLRDLGLILVTWFVMFVLMIIAAVVVTTFVPDLLGAGATEPAENPAATGIQENPEFILIGIVGMFLVVGPTEELLFRGVVQNRLRERFSTWPAIVLASALFAIAHTVALAGQDPVAIAMTISILFVPSLGLGWIYEYTGNIVVPSILHGFHNSVLLVLLWSATTMEGTAVLVGMV